MHVDLTYSKPSNFVWVRYTNTSVLRLLCKDTNTDSTTTDVITFYNVSEDFCLRLASAGLCTIEDHRQDQLPVEDQPTENSNV